MVNKTKEYSIFIFREDNKHRIEKSHIKRIVDSIKSRNLLELRPILVNQKMEIIDGQHRLLAAKELGVEIYYTIEQNLGTPDIILLNSAQKNWVLKNYLNYYCENGYKEYLKLKEFMKKNDLPLRVALDMCHGKTRKSVREFKEGKFTFTNEFLPQELEICWQTIEYIQKMNGFSAYTTSSRFWRALLRLVRNIHFDARKWEQNLSRMVERFTAKASTEDYCRLMMEVHNWKNSERVNLLDENLS